MAASPVPSYFVVMIDYGRKGREAIVDPELTRRAVVDRVLSGEYPREAIAFIQYISPGELPANITEDILAECDATGFARALKGATSRYEHMLAEQDHARDLRKHLVLS